MASLKADPDALHTTEEAAAYLGRKPATLRWWRSQGQGPKFSGQRRGVRYRRRHLDEWIDANTRTGTQ